MASDNRGFTATRRETLRRAGLAAAPPVLSLPLFLRARSAAATEKPSGRVEIEQIQISALISAGWGHGTLYHDGTHRFSIKGLGVGGLGVDRLEAYGNVFRLTKLSDFSGTYGSAQAGAVAGDAQLRGGIWMQNTSGVQIHLLPKRKGLALNLDAGGVLITLDT